MNQPKRLENANILVANTPMDTDKIKVMMTCLLKQCSQRSEKQASDKRA